MAQWGAQRPRDPRNSRISHARDARVLTLVDDYEDRNAGAVGLTPDRRVSLEFRPFASQSYLHLRNRRLAVLSKAPVQGGFDPWISRTSRNNAWDDDFGEEEAYNEDDDNADSDGEYSAAGRGGEIRRPREAELFDVVRFPLEEALDAVHERLDRRALMIGGGGRAGGGGGAGEGVERVKLLVRLGKLLFSAQGRSESALVNIPPFSASDLEGHMNEKEPFEVAVQRTYETNLPEAMFRQVEDMLLNDGRMEHSIREKYNIQVVDTREHVVYKAVCKYLAHERRFIVKKVKKPPVRHAVIDIARPDKVVDARLILTTETYLTALDGDVDAAIDQILEATQIDPRSPAGLRIPTHMTETRGTSGSSRSSRFRVRAVRHATTRRAVGGGRVWKVARVDGVEYKQGGGRRTNEIEFCPIAWQRELKGGAGGSDSSSRQQQAPTWSTEDIMQECPGLLAWISQHLP